MPRLSKTFSSVFALSFSGYFLFNSCMDQKLNSNPTPAKDKNGINNTTSTSIGVATFSSDVGAPIDQATGIRWMHNFAISNQSAARDYIIPVGLLKSILGGPSCVGVALFYAVDDARELHIIPIGVNSAGKVIAWENVTLGKISINWETAWRWINNYTGSPRSHFFGSQILVSTYLKNKNMRISRALNDAGMPQLLLSNADDITSESYGDESRPCPPFCPNL